MSTDSHQENADELTNEVLLKITQPREIFEDAPEYIEGASDNEDSWAYNEHKYGPRRRYINGVLIDKNTYKAKCDLWKKMKTHESVCAQPDVAARLTEKMTALTLKEKNLETREMKGVEDSLVVQTLQWQPHSGLPEKVQKECVLEHERREEIARMWKEEGSVKTYIPGSEEARKMKLQAKLMAKQMAKDELILADAAKPAKILSVEDVPKLLPLTEAPI